MVYRVRTGFQTSLWYHNWLGSGPICNVVLRDIPEAISHWRVGDIMRHGRFDVSRIAHILPSHVIDDILSYPLAEYSSLEDVVAWNPSSSGQFTVK